MPEPLGIWQVAWGGVEILLGHFVFFWAWSLKRQMGLWQSLWATGDQCRAHPSVLHNSHWVLVTLCSFSFCCCCLNLNIADVQKITSRSPTYILSQGNTVSSLTSIFLFLPTIKHTGMWTLSCFFFSFLPFIFFLLPHCLPPFLILLFSLFPSPLIPILSFPLAFMPFILQIFLTTLAKLTQAPGQQLPCPFWHKPWLTIACLIFHVRVMYMEYIHVSWVCSFCFSDIGILSSSGWYKN